MSAPGPHDGSRKPGSPANDPAEATTAPPAEAPAASTAGNARQSTPAPAADPGKTGPYQAPDGASLPPMSGPPVGAAPQGPGAVAIPGYDVLGELGRGGMGVVYKARHIRLKRLVAVKMILSSKHSSPDSVARFQTEAEAIARLQHPGIVQVFEIGECGEFPFLSLEFCGGGSLARKLGGTPLPPREAAAVVEKLARAMQYAHDAGVIHRDLKPANVLLADDGTPKVSDFGLAKKLDEAGQTLPGLVMGTPSYMAPEQAEGKEDIGPPCDVYALGAILYECLTGRPPFKAATGRDTILQVVSADPVSPRSLNAGVPRDLDTICLKCLEKEPARRYAGAGALAEDLRRFQANEPILAHSPGARERFVKWCGRNPRVAMLSGGFVLGIIAYAATASILIGDLYHEMGLKEEARQDAVKEEKKAKENEKIAKDNEKIAKDRQMIALQDVVSYGRKTLVRELGRLPAQAAPDAPRTVRLDVLRDVRQQLALMAEDMKLTAFNHGAVRQQTADFAQDMGLLREAQEENQAGLKLIEQVADEEPDKARGNMAVVYLRLGRLARELDGDVKAARGHFEKARALRQEVADHPYGTTFTARENRIALAYFAVDLGLLELWQGRLGAAREQMSAALEARREWAGTAEVAEADMATSYLSEACLWLGVVRAHQGDKEEADKLLQEALDLCEGLAKKSPDNLSYHKDLAEIHGARGDVQALRGDWQGASASYQKAREHAIAAKLPATPEGAAGQVLLARTIERLGTAAEQRGDAKDAQGRREMSLKLREALSQIEPACVTWQAARLLALAHLGREDAAAADELTKCAAGNAELLLQLARYHAVRAGHVPAGGPRGAVVNQALALLDDALKAGYADRLTLTGDPDLAALRDEAGYRALLDRLTR